jgi:hypothetical protein
VITRTKWNHFIVLKRASEYLAIWTSISPVFKWFQYSHLYTHLNKASFEESSIKHRLDNNRRDLKNRLLITVNIWKLTFWASSIYMLWKMNFFACNSDNVSLWVLYTILLKWALWSKSDNKWAVCYPGSLNFYTKNYHGAKNATIQVTLGFRCSSSSRPLARK